MNWYLIFYLFTVADKLSEVFLVFSWVLGGSTAIAIITYFGCMIEPAPKTQSLARRWVWWGFPLFAIMLLCYMGTPTRKEALIIIAGGAVGQFITTDTNAQKLPADLTRFLRTEISKAGTDLDLHNILGIETERDKLKKLSKEELIHLADSLQNR